MWPIDTYIIGISSAKETISRRFMSRSCFCAGSSPGASAGRWPAFDAP